MIQLNGQSYIHYDDGSTLTIKRLECINWIYITYNEKIGKFISKYKITCDENSEYALIDINKFNTISEERSY